MPFEFDPGKDEINKAKHGIDFTEAQALWAPGNLRVEIPAQITEGQMRYAVIGKIGGKLHTAIITYRGAAIRIISVREAKNTEIEIYDQKKSQPKK